MTKMSNTIFALALTATLAGTSLAFAQTPTEPKSDQSHTTGDAAMKEMHNGGMQEMKTHMAEMMKMMENCNRMMKAKGDTPDAAPQPR